MKHPFDRDVRLEFIARRAFTTSALPLLPEYEEAIGRMMLAEVKPKAASKAKQHQQAEALKRARAEKLDAIRGMVAAGWNVEAIAAKLGCARSGAMRYIREATGQ